MADLVVGIGLDNSEFRRAADASLTQTQVFASRIGQLIETHTKPIQNLAKGITSIGVVAGLATGALGFVSSIVIGLTQGIDSLSQANQEAARRAAEHAQKQNELAASIRRVAQDAEAARTGFTRVGAFGDPVPQEVLDRVRELDQLINDLDVILPGSATSNEAFNSPQNQQRLAEYNELLRERSRLIREANENRVGDFALQAEIDYLKAAGLLREAQVLEEGKLTAERRRRITEIAGEDERLQQRLEDSEIRRHQEKLRQIEIEAQKRRQQQEEEARRAKEQEERERKQREQQQFDRDILEQQQELERLKLTHQDKAAEALERELEHRRKIREIEKLEGISEEQRARLLANENRNFGLRGQPGPAGVGDVRQAQAGLISNPNLLRQIFGGPGGQTPEEKTNQLIQQTLNFLKEWQRSGGFTWA